MTIHRTIHIITPDTHIAILADGFAVATPWGERRYTYPTSARAADDFMYAFRFNVDLDARSLDWLCSELHRRAQAKGVSQ